MACSQPKSCIGQATSPNAFLRVLGTDTAAAGRCDTANAATNIDRSPRDGLPHHFSTELTEPCLWSKKCGCGFR
jgi:hypothetical protein